MAKNNDIPWDIYVDERKVSGDYALGFLIVPNTASFFHKLHRCRHQTDAAGAGKMVTREIHWNTPHLDCLAVAFKWIDRVFQHRGARFFLQTWPPGETKELAVLRFLSRFCRVKGLSRPFNVVMFLDFDSDHARAKIQNHVREVGNIARCYHLDSKNNDCLQCCDLMLGAAATVGNNPTVRLEYQALLSRWENAEKLKDSEVKKVLAGYLASRIDSDGTCVYDRRINASGGNRD
jgi:hypothetical protein